MEEKPRHEKDKINPFTEAKQKKKSFMAKEKMKEVKNKLWAAQQSSKTFREDKGPIKPKEGGSKVDAKIDKKLQTRKREQKSLQKSMQTAQLSTASMGNFDRKLRNEPAAPKSQKRRLKDRIGGNELSKIHQNIGAEKTRNLSILKKMGKKAELDAGERMKAHMDTNKMVK